MNKYNQKKFFNNLFKYLKEDEYQLKIWLGYYKFNLIDVHGVSTGNTMELIKEYISIYHTFRSGCDSEEKRNMLNAHVKKYRLLVK